MFFGELYWQVIKSPIQNGRNMLCYASTAVPVFQVCNLDPYGNYITLCHVWHHMGNGMAWRECVCEFNQFVCQKNLSALNREVWFTLVWQADPCHPSLQPRLPVTTDQSMWVEQGAARAQLDWSAGRDSGASAFQPTPMALTSWARGMPGPACICVLL